MFLYFYLHSVTKNTTPTVHVHTKGYVCVCVCVCALCRINCQFCHCIFIIQFFNSQKAMVTDREVRKIHKISALAAAGRKFTGSLSLAELSPQLVDCVQMLILVINFALLSFILWPTLISVPDSTRWFSIFSAIGHLVSMSAQASKHALAAQWYV